MIRFENVNLIYPNGVKALEDISFSVDKGEFVFIVGSTAAGKSSILKLIYRDMLPTSGHIYVNNQDVVTLKKNRVPYLRRSIGVVFQDFKLLPQKTVYENVAYALEVIGTPKFQIDKAVRHTLDLVGLSDKHKAFPTELSGGESQRISIARALVNHPLILIADEPTGNLDPVTSREIIMLLERINSKGTTVLIATHDRDIVDFMKKRVVTITSGRITDDQERSSYSTEGFDPKANNKYENLKLIFE
ncbi:MAG: cell division ATP-binding protein FtsE [Armatimonadota bacterium]